MPEFTCHICSKQLRHVVVEWRLSYYHAYLKANCSDLRDCSDLATEVHTCRSAPQADRRTS
jgi:hypothetical protein